MKKLELTFNPYTKTAEIRIGGKTQTKLKQTLCGADGTDLAAWAGDFFKRALAHFNDCVDVTFNGIARDYEFLEDALAAAPDQGSVLTAGAISKPEDRLEKLRALFARMQKESPFPALKSKEQKRLFTEATDANFEMAAVATVSAGKSTLINSMLGRELLPARHEATTARIARIRNIKDLDEFSARVYDGDGRLLEPEIKPLDKAGMERLNGMREAMEIDISGFFPDIESSDVSLVIADTPGPNNSQSVDHKTRTFDLLNSEWKPMILYVLNATQLGVDDDSHLLDKVASLVKSGDRQSHDRFLFVLNKADELDPGKNDTAARYLDNAAKYLESHGIPKPRIMPASAMLAKLIRQKRNGDAMTEDEKEALSSKCRRFVRDEHRHFTDFARFLSPATGAALQSRVEKAISEDDQEELALLYSGVPSIEMAISEYLVKYAVPDKIARGVATFKSKIEGLKIEADAKKEIKRDKKKLDELLKAIERLEAVLAKGDMAKKFKEQIAALSIESETKQILALSSATLMEVVESAIEKIKGSVRIVEAKDKLKKLKTQIDDIQADFISTVKHGIKKLLDGVEEDCKKQYEQYVKDILGAAEFSFPAEFVLPQPEDVGESDEELEKFTFTRNEKTGRQIRKDNLQPSTVFTGLPSVRATWARFLGKKSLWGRDAYVYVDEYETRKYLNLDDYVEKSLRPKIENFSIATQDVATGGAEEALAGFKKSFLRQLSKLDAGLKKKAGEMAATLGDADKRKAALEQKESDLRWLENFIADLDGILAI